MRAHMSSKPSISRFSACFIIAKCTWSASKPLDVLIYAQCTRMYVNNRIYAYIPLYWSLSHFRNIYALLLMWPRDVHNGKAYNNCTTVCAFAFIYYYSLAEINAYIIVHQTKISATGCIYHWNYAIKRNYIGNNLYTIWVKWYICDANDYMIKCVL